VEKSNGLAVPESSPTWEGLEEFARRQVQRFIQQVLEEEVTALLGRRRSERRAAVDGTSGYRNSYGKPRWLALRSETIQLRRPRVRGLERRFESRVPAAVRAAYARGEPPLAGALSAGAGAR
jgi:putative transposase